MPKRGVAKCEECDKEFEGEFPDNQRVGYSYVSAYRDPIDRVLVERLQEHHLDTARVKTPVGPIFGHKNFIVFLQDGNQGTLEVNSYTVVYKELGKERG